MITTKVKNIIFNDGKPKICVPITGSTDEQILNDFEILENLDFDLVELRIDYYEHVENFNKVSGLLRKIRKSYTKPLLFTFRTVQEGGMHDISEEKYFSLNHFAIESRLVDMLDIELFNSQEEIKKIIDNARLNNVKIIMSNHDFNKTPSKEEIIHRLTKMQEYGADITKIAVMPNTEEDVLTLISATLEMKKTEADRPFVTISMGSLGVITRLTGELFGSCMTFAALNNTSAPGQINVRNAREILELLSI